MIRTPMFAAAAIITAITSFSPICQYIYFKTCIAPRLELKQEKEKRKQDFVDPFEEPRFRREDWVHNKECSECFSRFARRYRDPTLPWVDHPEEDDEEASKYLKRLVLE